MTTAASIRVCLAQLKVRPGRPVENTERMLEMIDAARGDGIDLLVFPEMAIPGYLIGDEWERGAFLRECEQCGEEIAAASEGLIVVYGNVGLDASRRNEDGRVRKYNACFVAENGRFVERPGLPYPFAAKTLMPNYREFDDSRYFHDTRKLAMETGCNLGDLLQPISTSRGRLGCMLCEDGWCGDYGVSPGRMLADAGADLLLNISCSPFTLNKNHKRNRVFSALAAECGVPLVYVNSVGVQDNGKTVFTFDGSSCIYDSHGHQVGNIEPFAEGSFTFDLPLQRGASFGQPINLVDDGMPTLYRAIQYGTQTFMDQCGIERIVVGVSGGIDSAVVAAIYGALLDPENLMLVNMPSRYNSATTRGIAADLAANIGCLYTDIPIEDSISVTRAQMDGLTISSSDGSVSREVTLSPFVMENVQARDRSSRILAALAAALGGAFTCNANKSEITVGYTTLYGDLAGYLANLADLWKTEVFDLATYLNAEVFNGDLIPPKVMAIPPSAELSDAQNVDQGLGDPLIYAYHDRLFASWVERWDRATPEDILAWYVDGELESAIGYDQPIAGLFRDAAEFIEDLERWWSLYQGMALAKRIQAPPVLAVKRRAFGFDHREAQTGPRYTRRYQQLKEALLAGRPR